MIETNLKYSISNLNRRAVDIKGSQPGPTLVVTAGMHGNEHEGVHAALSVAEDLQSNLLRGRFIVLIGNFSALQSNQRYVDVDLVRAFTEERIEVISAQEENLIEDTERKEQISLIEQIDNLAEENIELNADLVFIDLHSTSSASVPFYFAETQPKDLLHEILPIPLITGFVNKIEGSFHNYLTNRNISSIVIEGGKIGEKNTSQRLADLLTITLESLNMLPKHSNSPIREKLASTCKSIPDKFKLLRTYKIKDEDNFQMKPGFSNFDKVTKGQELAQDKNGPIISPLDAFLFMPLYQAEGDTGFWLIDKSI